jgi:hypothetical protein
MATFVLSYRVADVLLATHLLRLPLYNFQLTLLSIKQPLRLVNQLSRDYHFRLRHSGVDVRDCGVSVIGRRGSAGRRPDGTDVRDLR